MYFIIYFSCEVAKSIPADSYALVFGVNTFMSFLLQTLLTVIITSPMGFMLDIRTQVKWLVNKIVKYIINKLVLNDSLVIQY